MSKLLILRHPFFCLPPPPFLVVLIARLRIFENLNGFRGRVSCCGVFHLSFRKALARGPVFLGGGVGFTRNRVFCGEREFKYLEKFCFLGPWSLFFFSSSPPLLLFFCFPKSLIVCFAEGFLKKPGGGCLTFRNWGVGISYDEMWRGVQSPQVCCKNIDKMVHARAHPPKVFFVYDQFYPLPYLTYLSLIGQYVQLFGLLSKSARLRAHSSMTLSSPDRSVPSMSLNILLISATCSSMARRGHKIVDFFS